MLWGCECAREVLNVSMRYWACPLAIRVCSGAVWCLGTEGFWKILVVGRCQRGCQHGQLRSRGNPQWIPAAARITAPIASIFSLSIHQSLSISLSFPFPNLLFLSSSLLSLFSSPFSVFYAFCLSSNSHLVFSLSIPPPISPCLWSESQRVGIEEVLHSAGETFPLLSFLCLKTFSTLTKGLQEERMKEAARVCLISQSCWFSLPLPSLFSVPLVIHLGHISHFLMPVLGR